MKLVRVKYDISANCPNTCRNNYGEALKLHLEYISSLNINEIYPQVTACDAPKPGGPLTNCQPSKNSSISGNLIPHCYVPFTRIHNLNKNHIESPLYGEIYPKSNM